MTQEQWQAILSRDPAYDDQFCYVFLPSGSICRPSCRMHKPKPNRIAVFQNAAQAIAEGYRPCTRCRPDIPGWQGTQQAMADAARQYLQDHYAEKFSLQRIADALFVDPCYLARIYRHAMGRTLLADHHRIRCEAACRLLERPDLEISFISDKVGFANASHFAQVFGKCIGCTPREYRKRYLSQFRME